MMSFFVPFLSVENFNCRVPPCFFEGDLSGRICCFIIGSRARRGREHNCFGRVAGELGKACVVKNDESMASAASTQSDGDGFGCRDQTFAECVLNMFS